MTMHAGGAVGRDDTHRAIADMRTRSNENVDALADAESALTLCRVEIASRSISMTTALCLRIRGRCNGNSTIRIRANLTYALCECAGSVCSPDARGASVTRRGSRRGFRRRLKYFSHPAGTKPCWPATSVCLNALNRRGGKSSDRLRVRTSRKESPTTRP